MELVANSENELHLLFESWSLSLFPHIEEYSSPNLPLKMVIFEGRTELTWTLTYIYIDPLFSQTEDK